MYEDYPALTITGIMLASMFVIMLVIGVIGSWLENGTPKRREVFWQIFAAVAIVYMAAGTAYAFINADSNARPCEFCEYDDPERFVKP